MPIDRRTAIRLVAIVCAAQVFVQLGAGYWPVLMPDLMTRWSLTNSEAGWITSAFYATYMVSVPVLVTATDRIDPKRVYLLGVGFTTIAQGIEDPASLERARTFGCDLAQGFYFGVAEPADAIDLQIATGRSTSRAVFR